MDTIFINFVDHGSHGILGFPHQLLYADQLNGALNTMHSKKSYKEVRFFIIIVSIKYLLRFLDKYIIMLGIIFKLYY